MDQFKGILNLSETKIKPFTVMATPARFYMEAKTADQHRKISNKFSCR